MGPDAGSGVASSAEGGVTDVAPPSDVTTTEDLPIAPVYGMAHGRSCGCRVCGFYGAVKSCRGEK